MTRRTFLKTATAATAFSTLPLHTLAAPHKGKVKITDVKCMIVRGTWDWNLIKVETDAGIYGIGEAYWGPGVKDLVLNQLKQHVIGEDPLNVDRLYTKMLMLSAGAGAAAGAAGWTSDFFFSWSSFGAGTGKCRTMADSGSGRSRSTCTVTATVSTMTAAAAAG